MKSKADLYFDASYLIDIYDAQLHPRHLLRGATWRGWVALISMMACCFAATVVGSFRPVLALVVVAGAFWLLFMHDLKKRVGVPTRGTARLDDTILSIQSMGLYRQLLIMGYQTSEDADQLRIALESFSPERRKPMSPMILIVISIIIAQSLALFQEAILIEHPTKRLAAMGLTLVFACLGVPTVNIIRLSGGGSKVRRLIAMAEHMLLDTSIRFPHDGRHPTYPPTGRQGAGHSPKTE